MHKDTHQLLHLEGPTLQSQGRTCTGGELHFHGSGPRGTLGGVREKWWEVSRGWSWRGGIGGGEGGGREVGGVVGVGEWRTGQVTDYRLYACTTDQLVVPMDT